MVVQLEAHLGGVVVVVAVGVLAGGTLVSPQRLHREGGTLALCLDLTHIWHYLASDHGPFVPWYTTGSGLVFPPMPAGLQHMAGGPALRLLTVSPP